MRDAGGLAVTTRARRCRILDEFLAGAFDARPIVIATIEALAIRRFVLPEKEGRSAGTVRFMGGAIGCYLRFRAIAGDDIDGSRAAIPRAYRRRLSGYISAPVGFCQSEVRYGAHGNRDDGPRREFDSELPRSSGERS
jgi:integrase/recombinase XerD